MATKSILDTLTEVESVEMTKTEQSKIIETVTGSKLKNKTKRSKPKAKKDCHATYQIRNLPKAFSEDYAELKESNDDVSFNQFIIESIDLNLKRLIRQSKKQK